MKRGPVLQCSKSAYIKQTKLYMKKHMIIRWLVEDDEDTKGVRIVEYPRFGGDEPSDTKRALVKRPKMGRGGLHLITSFNSQPQSPPHLISSVARICCPDFLLIMLVFYRNP